MAALTAARAIDGESTAAAAAAAAAAAVAAAGGDDPTERCWRRPAQTEAQAATTREASTRWFGRATRARATFAAAICERGGGMLSRAALPTDELEPSAPLRATLATVGEGLEKARSWVAPFLDRMRARHPSFGPWSDSELQSDFAARTGEGAAREEAQSA